MHLCQDKDALAVEEEHRPEAGATALHPGHQRVVRQHTPFERDPPLAVDVDAREEQPALQRQQQHVHKVDQVPAGGFHGKVPEGIDCGSGKDIAMVALRGLDKRCGQREVLAE